jgi:hypothetical protein
MILKWLVGDKRHAYWFLLGNLMGRGPFEDLGLDGRIILKWLLGDKRHAYWFLLGRSNGKRPL